MKNKNSVVCFVYSPLHLHILEAIFAVDDSDFILIKPKSLEKNIIKEEILIDDVTSGQRLFVKFRNLIHVLWNVNKYQMDILFTANEHAPISILLLMLFRPKEVWVCDEGNIDMLVLKDAGLRQYRIKFFIKKVLTFGFLKERFSHPKITRFYTLNETSAKKILGSIKNNSTKVVDVLKLEKDRGISSYSTVNEIWLLTSPLTENGNSRYHWQEIDVLAELVSANPRFRFVIKPHYREDYKKKYTDLVNKFDNLKFINPDELEKGVQNINYLPLAVIGFHSTALDFYARLGNIAVFTLSKFVGSQHSSLFLMSKNPLIMELTSYELNVEVGVNG